MIPTHRSSYVLTDGQAILYLADFGGGIRQIVLCTAQLHTSGTWRAVSSRGTHEWWRFNLEERGLTWAMGWNTPEADALRVFVELSP